jgi:hypothetical protein
VSVYPELDEQLLWGGPIQGGNSYQAGTLSAAGYKLSFVFAAPKDGNLSAFTFDVTSGSMDGTLTIETPIAGANPNPDGVALATKTFSWPTTGLKTVTLDTPLAVTKGQMIAVVITNTNGVSCGVRRNIMPSSGWGGTNVPVGGIWNNASWSYTSWQGKCLIGVWYDGVATYVPGCSFPSSTGGSGNSFNLNTGSADERGNLLTVPYDMEVTGVWSTQTTVSTGDFEHRIYDADGNVLATYSTVGSPVVSARAGTIVTKFAESIILHEGDVIRVTKRALTATNTYVQNFGIGAASHLAGFPFGTAARACRRLDLGAWTDEDTSINEIGLVVRTMYTAAGGTTFARRLGRGICL